MSEESYLDGLLKDVNNTEEFSLSDEEMDNLDVSGVKDVDFVGIDLNDIDISDIDLSSLTIDVSDLDADVPMAQESGDIDVGIPQMDAVEDVEFGMPEMEDVVDVEVGMPEMDTIEVDMSEMNEVVDVEIDMLLGDEAGDIGFEIPLEEVSAETPAIEEDLTADDEKESSILGMLQFEKSDEDDIEDVDNLLDMLSDNSVVGGNSANIDEPDSFFTLDGLMDMDDDVSFDDTEDNAKETADLAGSEENLTLDELETDSLEDDLMGILNGKAEEKPQPKKDSLFTKLFANIHDAKSKRAHEKMLSDEEKKALRKKEREEKKAAKKAMKEDPAYIAEQEAKKKEKEEQKAQARAVKEAKKREKEELKRQKRAEEEAEALKDQGRINRVGATIVFVCLGAFAASVILGSNSFSYNQSVANAKEYFGNREYTEAYNEIRGVDLKGEDVETYDKIVTVMYVNKQLNSYNNYYAMQMYPEALDSLLKGLQKYDAHIEAGEQLGIINDLDYVRSQIMEELQKVFLLDEREAYDIIESSTQEDYSQKVIEAAQIE